MRKYIHEILDEINNDVAKLEVYQHDKAILAILKYAFDNKLKFLLPSGVPVYKQDPSPMGIAPSELIHKVSKFYVFRREDITETKREQLFIQFLESLSKIECDILIAIKNQNLTSLYPKITKKVVEPYLL